jgi:SAM-dependent methyltransferase
MTTSQVAARQASPSKWQYARQPKTFARKAFNRLRFEARWQQRLNHWDSLRFDRKLGVDTSGRLEPADLTIAAGDVKTGHLYVGTQPRLAKWWLGGLPRNRGEYTFVDMGSGKGRVLLVAAQEGFRRSVGVEFAKELHDAAAINARIVAERGLTIEPVLGDAGAFDFPDDPLVVHFNNPFDDPVMFRVIANLTASYERRRRPVIVLYQQMKVEQQGHVTNNLELLEAVPFLTARQLPPPAGAIDRRLLAPFKVGIYESVEALG